MADTAANRRMFLKTAVGGATVPLLTPPLAAAAGAGPNEFAEPGRNLPLVQDADVIVCGAGPAGVSAAITAARTGARVRLFELHGCLGGIWTSGLLSWVIDFNKPGFTRELTAKLDERGARHGDHPGHFVYEPDEMKLLLEDLCAEAGVQFRLHSRVAAAYRDGNRLTTIITESKAGREAWRAPVFIDTTGDGDLGALSGCGWDIGESKDCPCQPLTLMALAYVKDHTKLGKYINHYRGDEKWHGSPKEEFKSEIRRAGFEPSYGAPSLFHVRDDIMLVMINHEYGILPFDVDAVTAATVRARREVFDVVRGLRNLGGVWEDMQVIATAEQIGVRDGRRIHGRYTVSRDDVATGARHKDAVVRPTFSVDIHATSMDKNRKGAYSNAGVKTVPYDIPLRALIAKDVDGLMMAGRCISGDFIAHASYRVTGNAVAMGEAAGCVASLAAQSKRLPHEVDWAEASAKLYALGLRVES